MKSLFTALALVFALASPAFAGTVVQAPLSITVASGALAEILNPSAASEACSVAAGTVVSAVSFSGGDGNAVTLSLSGGTASFVLSSTTAPANVVVAPGGILAADCGHSQTITVQGSQN